MDSLTPHKKQPDVDLGLDCSTKLDRLFPLSTLTLGQGIVLFVVLFIEQAIAPHTLNVLLNILLSLLFYVLVYRPPPP